MSALDQVWLVRGGSFVLANIRGGGEYGPQWHQFARLENCQRASPDATYPEVFLWTNPKDDRVHPGHGRKMAAA